MNLSNIVIQLLNGLASASTLFLVAAGLSLIFGVTRIVNFAHGSFFMLGMYVAIGLGEWFGRGSFFGFWGGVVLASIVIGLIGAVCEIVLLRRIYRAPELFQLLATFGLVMIAKDAVLYFWGPEDILGPRAPGLRDAVTILGRSVPEYDLFLIVVGPVVLGILHLILTRTRWGTLIRAATEDREMVGALGVNQAWLFTGVFALGALLAGLAGALQLPREPATAFIDLTVISDAFVIVVVGGLGSLPGAYLAALLIGLIKALCIGLGDQTLFGITFSFSKLTLVIEFLVMAVVLVVKPWGLLGRPQALQRVPGLTEMPIRPATSLGNLLAILLVAVLASVPLFGGDYTMVLLIDIFIFALFAASLHFGMGPGGLVSFGHAAYFGLGAYGAGLAVKLAGWPMEVALIAGPILAGAGALLFGWFCVRLSGVYLAMLTLAFAQIVWSVAFQWDSVTGGSNGLVGVWPAPWLASKPAFYLMSLVLCGLGIWLLRRIIYSPFGYAMRAGRDSPLRADAIGIDVRRVQWYAFVVTGLFAGVAGAIYAFSKGSLSPETLGISRSVDALLMVLLGGVQTLSGPFIGAGVFTWLSDELARDTTYWRAVLGVVIIVLVLAFPEGIVGFAERQFARWRKAPI